MRKSILFFVVLICSVTLFTGCIPPFFDGGITATDFFGNDVIYSTFIIDAAEENGFKELDEGRQSLDAYIDGDEQNIPMRAYKRITFITKAEGSVTDIAFMVQSDIDCTINFSVFYGKNFCASESVTLKGNVINTVFFSGLQITLEVSERLNFVITNPVELGTAAFRTDSYIFIGQGAENV